MPSFLERVTAGLDSIKKKHPEAMLYEVDAAANRAIADPKGLCRLRVICRVKGGTARISSSGPGRFGRVQFVPAPWLGNVVISWPVKMDVGEAAALLRAAGHRGRFKAVTLRRPLYRGLNEPYYIFSMSNGQFIFVGVDDRKVFPGQ